MVESVVAKWSREIDEMKVEAMRRWQNELDALNQGFQLFNQRFNGEVRRLNGEVRGTLFHIWGTQEDMEAWKKRLRR